MRIPLTWTEDRLHGGSAALWAPRLAWACSDARLELALIGLEPLALPEPSAEEPAAAALARLLRHLAGSPTLVALLNPGEAFGVARIPLAAGVRLLGIAGEADLACWDALLAGGQPCYGLRGRLVVEVLRPDAGGIWSALAYGAFTCEEGLEAASLVEDRAGVVLETGREASFAVIARGGFEVARSRGRRLERRDTGSEGVVRVEAVADDGGRLWTQPRLVAPRQEACHG